MGWKWKNHLDDHGLTRMGIEEGSADGSVLLDVVVVASWRARAEVLTHRDER